MLTESHPSEELGSIQDWIIGIHCHHFRDQGTNEVFDFGGFEVVQTFILDQIERG